MFPNRPGGVLNIARHFPTVPRSRLDMQNCNQIGVLTGPATEVSASFADFSQHSLFVGGSVNLADGIQTTKRIWHHQRTFRIVAPLAVHQETIIICAALKLRPPSTTCRWQVFASGSAVLASP